MDREERIRRRAYNIWCAEGWPRGRDKEHWAEASKALEHDIGQVKEAASADGQMLYAAGRPAMPLKVRHERKTKAE
jgi:hypothetical protein